MGCNFWLQDCDSGAFLKSFGKLAGYSEVAPSLHFRILCQIEAAIITAPVVPEIFNHTVCWQVLYLKFIQNNDLKRRNANRICLVLKTKLKTFYLSIQEIKNTCTLFADTIIKLFRNFARLISLTVRLHTHVLITYRRADWARY